MPAHAASQVRISVQLPTFAGPPLLVPDPRPGTNVGGGTFWGLCRLLTGVNNFDDILTLSSQGDNSNVRTVIDAAEPAIAQGAGGLLPAIQGGCAPSGPRWGSHAQTSVGTISTTHPSGSKHCDRWTCWWATSTGAGTTLASACRPTRLHRPLAKSSTPAW